MVLNLMDSSSLLQHRNRKRHCKIYSNVESESSNSKNGKLRVRKPRRISSKSGVKVATDADRLSTKIKDSVFASKICQRSSLSEELKRIIELPYTDARNQHQQSNLTHSNCSNSAMETPGSPEPSAATKIRLQSLLKLDIDDIKERSPIKQEMVLSQSPRNPQEICMNSISRQMLGGFHPEIIFPNCDIYEKLKAKLKGMMCNVGLRLATSDVTPGNADELGRLEAGCIKSAEVSRAGYVDDCNNPPTTDTRTRMPAFQMDGLTCDAVQYANHWHTVDVPPSNTGGDHYRHSNDHHYHQGDMIDIINSTHSRDILDTINPVSYEDSSDTVDTGGSLNKSDMIGSSSDDDSWLPNWRKCPRYPPYIVDKTPDFNPMMM